MAPDPTLKVKPLGVPNMNPTPNYVDSVAKAQENAPAGVTVTKTATAPNLLTATGGYNPRTGGTETINPSTQVNTGAYSAQAKIDLAKSKGLTGNVSQDAFYRGTGGELAIKDEYLPKTVETGTTTGAVVGPATTPAVTTPTVTTPKVETPLPVNAPKLASLRATGMTDDQILKSVGDKYGTDSAQFRALTSELYPSAETLAKKSPEQQELDRKLQEDIKHTKESYILNQAEFEKNKADYINYDQVAPKYQGLLDDISNTMSTTGKTTLTDQEYQQIAARNGVSLDEAKDPRKLFDQLQLSEAGKQKTGVSKYEFEMEDAKIKNERAKQDLAENLKFQQKSIDDQLTDVQAQLDNNIRYMEDQGAWTGAISSSAYRQGIQNARQDGMRVIQKLTDMKDKITTANQKDVARLQEDYNKAVNQAKSDFDYQMNNIKQQNGVQLAGLTEKYGIGSTTLSRALAEIQKNYGTQSIEVLNSYLNAQKTIASTMEQNIENTNKLMALENAEKNKGYESYIANNGALLSNSTLGSIAQDYKAGKLDTDHYNQLKAVMLQSITNTLNKVAPVDGNDMNTIQSLLNQGKTPTEVVSAMQSLSKYSGAGKEWQYQEINRYNPDTGTTEQVPVWINTKTQEIRQAMPGTSAGTGGAFTGTLNTSGGDDISSLYTGNNGPAFANNNPGNIKDTGFGGVAGGQGGFTKFATVQEGINALLAKLDNAKAGNSRVYSPDMTLTQFFQKYAPSSDNNNPIAYAQAVAKGAGVTPNTKLKDVDTELLAMGIMKHENGAVYNELVKRGIIGAGGINTQVTPKKTPTQTTQEGYSPEDESAFKKYLNDGTIPAQYKTPVQKQQFKTEYQSWKDANAPLTDKQQASVEKIAGNFDNEQTVKNYQVAQTGKNYAASLNDNTTNPADDIGLIYALAKAFDPNSVVREGEYNTAQKYVQNWADTFKFDAKRVFSNTSFLTPEARKSIKKSIEQSFKSHKASYDQVYKEYARRIDKVTKGTDGDSYLTEYSVEEAPATTGATTKIDTSNAAQKLAELRAKKSQ